VLDSTTKVADSKSGVEITITNGDASRIAEIRRRAGRMAEATKPGNVVVESRLLELCPVVIKDTRVMARDVDGGVKLSVQALKTADVESLRAETHKRHQRQAEASAKPHATLIVDSASPSAVWVDGVDSGYMTPTDGIFLAPGKHEVVAQDGAGHRGTPTTVVILQGQTQRLLLR
jgi:hypothetical protein